MQLAQWQWQCLKALGCDGIAMDLGMAFHGYRQGVDVRAASRVGRMFFVPSLIGLRQLGIEAHAI